MQTSRSPESARKPSPTATATGTLACLASALSSSRPNTAACQASASQVNWRRTNRLFTLLCTTIQGPLKVSPWEHESTVVNESITTDLSVAVQESLREDLSAPGSIKSKQEIVKRGNPIPDPKFIRSPPLRTSAPLASDENQTNGLAQQREAGVGGVAPRLDDVSSPSPSTTSDTLRHLSSTILTDQSESCRGSPVTMGMSSSSSQHRGAVQPDTGERAHSVVEVSGTPSSMSSSAAFESNMDDIEQYLGQDLEGFDRLSY
ncbi:unnamed protein product [Mortierella alpina]